MTYIRLDYVENGQPNPEGQEFILVFSVGRDEIEVAVEVWFHRTKDDIVDQNRLELEITGIKPTFISDETKKFRTNRQSGPSPYRYGTTIGSTAVRKILEMTIKFVENHYKKKVASITGERVTGSSAYKKSKDKYISIH